MCGQLFWGHQRALDGGQLVKAGGRSAALSGSGDGQLRVVGGEGRTEEVSVQQGLGGWSQRQHECVPVYSKNSGLCNPFFVSGAMGFRMIYVPVLFIFVIIIIVLRVRPSVCFSVFICAQALVPPPPLQH